MREPRTITMREPCTVTAGQLSPQRSQLSSSVKRHRDRRCCPSQRVPSAVRAPPSAVPLRIAACNRRRSHALLPLLTSPRASSSSLSSATVMAMRPFDTAHITAAPNSSEPSVSGRVRRCMTQRNEAVGLAVGQHVCRPSRGGSQRAQFELSQDRML